MMDAAYVGITLLFFLLTWGFLVMCDRLDQGKKGEKP